MRCAKHNGELGAPVDLREPSTAVLVHDSTELRRSL